MALASLHQEALSLNDLMFLQKRAKRLLAARNQPEVIRFPPQLEPPVELEQMISAATSSGGDVPTAHQTSGTDSVGTA